MMNNDDPKLTAYALGELDENDRRAIEARLENDPAGREEVAQIRGVASLLKEQLAAEPLPEPAIPSSFKLARRRRRWAELALAASVMVAVSGVAVTILLPVMSKARYASKATAAKAAAAANMRQAGAAERVSATKPQPPPFDDILRYPANWPDVSELRDQEMSKPDALSLRTNHATPVQPPGGTNNSSSGLSSGAYAVKQQLSQSDDIDSVSGSSGYFRGTVAMKGSKLGPHDAKDSVQLPADWDADRDLDQGFGNDRGGKEAQKRYFEQLGGTHAFNTEAYDRVVDNAFLDVVQNPLSTFSIDVDTASYSNVRRFLQQGQRPPKDAVRIEELVNYFPYDYERPAKSDEKPFAAHVEVSACPWQPRHRLVRIGLKGKEIAPDKRPASNLVFLIDVSGSMNHPNKLPLVKRSMRMLTEQLGGEDRVAMVVYAGNSGLVLPSTSCNDADKQSIFNALDNLEAGGSTNGAQGIELAYQVAQSNFIKGGTNRVILCTDGDFNVGVTNQGDLTRLIEQRAKGGVFLSVLGFGMGNLKDSTMEKLADKGNGNYAYIDSQSEAKKVLVEQMSGTLVTIAKDVKIQIEFNPAVVGRYRLIGYENRLLAKEDFNDDKKDAGEIGAGHAVTALYEVVPADAKAATTAPAVDQLKYQKNPLTNLRGTNVDTSGEMLTLKLRYKQPDSDSSKLIEVPVRDSDVSFAKASGDFKFASAVAAFGMILRDSPHKGTANYAAVMEWAEDGLGVDASGYRHEFIDLVKRARSIEGK